MITPIPAPAMSAASGLARPRNPATGAGKPKIPLPIILLTTSATMLQRPMARTNSVCELCGALAGGIIGPLYHIERVAAPTGGRGPTPTRRRVSALQLRDTPRVQLHWRAL